jgi:hypothetical protein
MSTIYLTGENGINNSYCRKGLLVKSVGEGLLTIVYQEFCLTNMKDPDAWEVKVEEEKKKNPHLNPKFAMVPSCPTVLAGNKGWPLFCL